MTNHVTPRRPEIAIKDLGDYPFKRTSDLLDPLTPQVETPINLTIGQPKAPIPAMVRNMINANDEWRLYPPTSGTPTLQEAILDWMIKRDDLTREADLFGLEPVCGAREGLFLLALLTRFMPRGKRRLIAVPNPGYAVYAGAAKIAGAKLLPMDTPAGVVAMPDQFDAQTLANLQLVFLCHPANPSGQLQPPEVMTAWIKAARENNFIVVSDECYAELYLHTPPTGILQTATQLATDDQDQGLFHRVVCVHSLSKRSSAAGIRSGFIAGDPALIAMIRQIKAYAGNRMPLGLQQASCALWSDEAHVREIRAHYQQNYRLCAEILSKDLLPQPLEAGMFAWLQVEDDLAAAKTLWQQAGIRTIPGRYLCLKRHEQVGRGRLRIAIVDDKKILAPALETIQRLLG